MAGNPFRRKSPPPSLPTWQSGDEATTSRELPQPEQTRKSSVVKRVRIQTPPPLSPDYALGDESPIISRISDENHPGSPPPDPSRIPSFSTLADLPGNNPFDRFGNEDEGPAAEETLYNTQKNSATGKSTTINVEDIAPGVKNPFARTLATMESTHSGVQSSMEDDGREPPQTVSASTSKRETMDVESFKRMLMTGTKESSGSEGPSVPSSSTTTTTSSSYFTGSSNSTDTSSISRQSVNDAPGELAADSPVSFEDVSPSDSDDDARTTPRPSSAQKVKPPPPKHRHGKSVGQARTPQVVSFSDFEPSVTTAESSRTQPRPTPSVPNSKGITEDSKALPTIPTSKRSAETRSATTEAQLPQGAPKAPPPAPVPRRTVQANPARQLLQRTDSSASNSSQASTSQSSTQVPASPPVRSPKLPPPPPPTRRTAGRPLSISEPFPLGLDQPDQSISPASRRSSGSSHQNMNMAPPPPPPPRRGRGSSKGSMDNNSIGGRGATSTTTLPSSQSSKPDTVSPSARRPSVSSLDPVKEDESASNAGNRGQILADMDALQAEIDALRAQHGNPSAPS